MKTTRTPKKAYRKFELDGQMYEIDLSGEHIRVSKLVLVSFGGAEEAMLRALGREHRATMREIISDEKRNEVIYAAGWKFSRSRRWQNAWEMARYGIEGRI